MLSLHVAVPSSQQPKQGGDEGQTISVKQRDLVGSLKVFVEEKGEEAPISSLSTRYLSPYLFIVYQVWSHIKY